MNKIKIFIYAMAFVITQSVVAQSDNMQRDTVVIKRTYKPEIKKGDKFYSAPLPETAYIAPPVINYTQLTDPKELALIPKVPQIKSLTLPSVKNQKLYGNYIKIGIGNFMAPLLDVSLMNLRSKEIAAGVNVHHFSNNGITLAKKWSENKADAYLTKYFDTYTWKLNAAYNRDARKFYAYEKSLENVIDKSMLNIHQQIFDISSSIDNNNIYTKSEQLKYYIGVKYSYLDNQYKFKEQNFNINSIISKTVRNNPFKLKSEIDFNGFEGNYLYNRIFVKLNPTYKLLTKDFTAEFGIKAVYVYSENVVVPSSKYYFYPDLKIDYKFKQWPLNAFAGVNGDNNKITWRSLTQDNPFMSKNIFLGNAQTNRIFYGLHGQISSKWTAEFNGFYYYNTTLPVYYMTYQSNFKTDSLSSFSILYDKMNYQQYQVNISYRQSEKWYFSMVGNMYTYNFKQDSLGLPYPTATIDLHAKYTMDQKILFKVDILGMTRRKIGFADSNLTNFKPIENIKGYVDLSLSVNYKYSQHVSAFIQFRNLTNSMYARWYNYPVNGINFLTGINITL
jgi:hypothetical protein